MPKYNYNPYLIDAFGGGLVTNVDIRNLPPGAYTQLLNLSSGRTAGAICKRYGTKDSACGVPSTNFEIIQIYYAVLDKSGTKTGYLFAQLKGDTNNLDLYYIEYNLSTRAWGNWQPIVSAVGFTSGGTYQVVPGDVITGAVSGATATVLKVTYTGNWASGLAEGDFYITQQDGTFVSENLNVGANNNVAAIAGDSANLGDVAYGNCKADKLNFSIFRGALRVGAGNYADSYPLWIGVIDREKTTDEYGYFHNVMGMEGLYATVAHLDEPDPNDLITSVSILQDVENPGRRGGSLIELGRYAFILTYEYDGYQEGNGKREKFYEVLVDDGDITIADNSTWPHTLVGIVQADLDIMNMRISAINIYCGQIPFGVNIVPPKIYDILKGQTEPTILVTSETGESVQEVPLHFIQRLDINKDDEIVKFFTNVADAGGGVGTVFRIEYKDPELYDTACPWPSDVFDNFYIKYRKVGTSAWTTKAILTTEVTATSDPDELEWHIDITIADAVAAGNYEVIIVNRWEEVLDIVNDIKGYRKYFIHNNLFIGSQYSRRFGNCNYKRSTFVNDRQVACGVYSLADDPDDLEKYEPTRLNYSGFDENGNPTPDKLSEYFYLTTDEDDEVLVLQSFLWRKDYRDEDLFAFCRKSIHHAKFNEEGLMSLVEQPYDIGLVAPDSLYFDGNGWWFIGRQGAQLGVYYFNPHAGKPQKLSGAVEDLINRIDKKYLKYAVGWYEPKLREYRFALPEFAS